MVNKFKKHALIVAALGTGLVFNTQGSDRAKQIIAEELLKTIEEIQNREALTKALNDPIVQAARAAGKKIMIHFDPSGGVVAVGSPEECLDKTTLNCCFSCHKRLNKPLLCSSCRSAVYCNKSCQREHWKREHKSWCKWVTKELPVASAGVGAGGDGAGK